MEEENAKELLKKYLSGDVTLDEEAIVEGYYKRLLLSGEANLNAEELERIQFRMKDQLMENIAATLTIRPRIVLWSRFVWAAASILIVVLAGLFVYTQQGKIKPGSDKAILTLADGRKIELDTNSTGELAHQGNVSVRNQNSGWLEYFGKSSKPGTNILSVPRGGKYKILLPDGTRIWLNAASTLEYPTAFTGKRREVKLTGEGFFEVSHDKNHPFVVQINGMNVTVLGTSFNIMAYKEEEGIKTTVVTGLVGVSDYKQSVLVKPGQQALYTNMQTLLVNQVDLEEITAWKEGLFKFNGTKLSAIMKQLSRWYNVDIDIKGNVPDQELYAIIQRDEDISHVLEILEKTSNLHFETSGRKIIVSAAGTK